MPETLSSRRHFEGHIVAVRTDEVLLNDGTHVKLEVVEHAESMTVVAVDADGSLLLVRQYRHPAGQVLLETAAGSVDPGETAEEAVNRELAEETGYQARRVIYLGSFYLAPGWATEFMHAYLARDLYESRLAPDEDERIEVVRLPIAEWEAMIARGEIRDCKSIAAWHLAKPHLLT